MIDAKTLLNRFIQSLHFQGNRWITCVLARRSAASPCSPHVLLGYGFTRVVSLLQRNRAGRESAALDARQYSRDQPLHHEAPTDAHHVAQQPIDVLGARVLEDQ